MLWCSYKRLGTDGKNIEKYRMESADNFSKKKNVMKIIYVSRYIA